MKDSTTTIWPLVPLGKVLTRSGERIEIQPDREYLQVTVRLWGGGVVLRNEVSGTKIAAKKRYVVRPQQFLLSRIDARNGAFGLVPDSLDGAVVSNDFPSFSINRKMLEPRFLEWMSKTKWFIDLCQVASEGTTNRVRLQVDRFLGTEIPLPPLDEQRRIVARIEELAALIEEAHGLRVKAREETESLLGSELNRMFDRSRDNDLPLGWNWLTIGELLKEGKDGIRTGPFGTLLNKSDFQPRGVPLIGIACVDANKFHPSRCDYIFEEKAEELTRYGVVNGDVIVARSGTVGRCCVVENLDLGIMSSNLMRLRFNMAKCNPRLVCQLLNGSALIQRQIDEKCRGTTRTFFNQKILTSMEAPLPGINEQHRIVAYLDALQAQVDELITLQDATRAELDALLPSVLDRAFQGEL